MAELLTLDVIDRPTRDGRRALGALGPGSGCRSVLRTATQDFREHLREARPPTTRRLALLVGWDPETDVQEQWGALIGPHVSGAREHWHVRGEITRANFSEPWQGWVPDTTGSQAHAEDEPALIFIAGDLTWRGTPGFIRDAPKTVRHANAHAGYLGGLALASRLANTTSCSAWRTYGDARGYAFASGAHRDAMLRDRGQGRHSTEWFFRVRPLASRGTLRGRDPFAGVLPAA